jgi:hypothetical protein
MSAYLNHTIFVEHWDVMLPQFRSLAKPLSSQNIGEEDTEFLLKGAIWGEVAGRQCVDLQHY